MGDAAALNSHGDEKDKHVTLIFKTNCLTVLTGGIGRLVLEGFRGDSYMSGLTCLPGGSESQVMLVMIHSV